MRLLVLSFLLLSFSSVTSAAIDFDAITSDQIDLAALKISKKSFFEFAADQVQEKKPGLGTYGIVEFETCAYPVNGRPLHQLQTLAGKPIRLLSTPSCTETVIQKVLEQNYNFDPTKPNNYKARRCIYTLIKAFRPMMEYYSMVYEERKAGDCRFCDDQEKRRLEKIAKTGQKTKQFCGSNQPKVQQFLQEFSNQLDQAYKAKTQAP